MFKALYEDELEYLRGLLHEYAEVYPEAAAELNLSGRDPATGRLIEGAAFLGAGVRQAIHQQKDGLLEPLLAHTWPHPLRPTPSATVVALDPVPELLRQLIQVPRHAQVLSQSLEGASCRFRTTAPTDILPICLERISQESESATRSRLTLFFQPLMGASLNGMPPVPLRIFVAGSKNARYPLFHALATGVQQLRLKIYSGLSSMEGLTRNLPPTSLRPLKWGPDDALLPHPPAGPAPWQALHEHLMLPELGLFLELHGIEWLGQIPELHRFELEIDLVHAEDSLPRVTPANLRLHCVPVVNLFRADALPVEPDPARAGLNLVPDVGQGGGAEVYNVQQVQWIRRRQAPVLVPPYFACTRSGPTGHDNLYHRVRILRPIAGLGAATASTTPLHARRSRYPTRLTFVDGTGAALTPEGIIRVQLLCSDGERAEQLRPQDLCIGSADIGASIAPMGLEPLSPTAPPRQDLDALAGLIAPLTQGLRWMTREPLGTLQRLLHPTAHHNKGQALILDELIRACVDAEMSTERHVLGSPPGVSAGISLRLRLDLRWFEAPDQLWHWADALREVLLETTASRHSLRLTVEAPDQQRKWQWTPERGRG